MQRDLDHISEIEAVSQGLRSDRPGAVIRSWLRCLNEHGLDPAQRAEAYILPDREVRAHRERSQDLIRIARSGIEKLYRLVRAQDYVLLLADNSGVTVEYLGDEAHKEALRGAGLYMGSEWSEARAGTCAVGACLAGGTALTVHQSDHFDVTHGGLSCTAAPIYNTRGQLAAVLDISLLSSPQPRASQSLAMNLVTQTAQRIELANLMAEARQDWVLRLGSNPDFLDVDPEAALRLDASGRIVGLTHGAARLVAETLGCDWRQPERLTGRHVSEVFDLDFARLEDLTRRHDARERLIETRGGHRMFAHAIEPRGPAPRALRAGPLVPPGLRALAGEDRDMARLVERAALLAVRADPVLIAGEDGSGRTTLAHALHEASGAGRLVTVDCAAVTEDEAALIFGREERRRLDPGRIAEAAGGTLVLDRVEELPLRLQARLLPLLAEGRYRPIGAMRDRPCEARVVMTTAADPEAEVAAGRLRRDLALRLAATRLDLPPLRARRDLLPLVRGALTAALRGPVTIEPEALACLAAHDWPGNWHDLAALVQGLADAATGRALTPGDLPAAMRDRAEPPERPAAVLAEVLAACDWNISDAARRLGCNRSTVHRQIARYGLSRP